MHIDSLELIWIVSNAIALLFTIIALADARRSQKLTARESLARQIIANGNVRREWFRLIVQLLLTSLVVPGLFLDNPAPLNYFVLVLLFIPIVLLTSTVLDYVERKQLAEEVWQELETEQKAGMNRLEAGVAQNQLAITATQVSITAAQVSIEENTALTKQAGAAAQDAYHEANSVNLKIANLQREDIALQKDSVTRRENDG